MKDYEIQSIVSLLERSAKELARLMRNKFKRLNKKYNGQK